MLDVRVLVVDGNDWSRICGIGEQGEQFLRAGGFAEGYLRDDPFTRQLNGSKILANWFVDPAVWTHEYERTASQAPKSWIKFYKGRRGRIY